MKTRIVHCKKAPYDVYIGRPSEWGNPFSHQEGTLAEFKVPTREDAIAAYEVYLKTKPDLLAKLPDLKGKTLGCWCKPAPCHGDVLARLADEDQLSLLIRAAPKCTWGEIRTESACHQGGHFLFYY